MKKNRTIAFRRKREHKTNYKKRIKLLSSKKPRLVVRRHLSNFSAQIINFEKKGDVVLVGVHSSALKKIGWNAHTGNIPSAYLMGLLLGKKAKEKGVNEAILDIGLHNPAGKTSLYAVLKGVVDSGIKINHSEGIFPSEERISGKHIINYLDMENKNNQFSKYHKTQISSKNFEEHFNSIKSKIMGK